VNAPIAWWGLALAATFTILSVLTSANYAVAVPTAAAAVIVASLTVGDAIVRTSARGTAAEVRPVLRSGVREWIAAGELGHEDLLLLLDRLERKILDPTLPARTPQAVGEIVTLTPQAFQEYVAERLEALERTG
jgi:hypothetical protein